MAEVYQQMNVNVTEEDAKMIDQLASEDGYDNRSAFVRRLIRQEWARRYLSPNLVVTIDQALEAGKELNNAG